MPSSAVDLLGALDKGVDQAAGDAVEHRPDDCTQRHAGKAVAQLQPDAAGALRAVAYGLEAPVALELGEWPLDQPHADLPARHMGVARGEALVDAGEGDADLGRHAVRVP